MTYVYSSGRRQTRSALLTGVQTCALPIFHNAVATLGTATSDTHVQKLFREVDDIIFCFDGDKAGRNAAWRALEATLGELADNKPIGRASLGKECGSTCRSRWSPYPYKTKTRSM